MNITYHNNERGNTRQVSKLFFNTTRYAHTKLINVTWDLTLTLLIWH